MSRLFAHSEVKWRKADLSIYPFVLTQTRSAESIIARSRRPVKAAGFSAQARVLGPSSAFGHFLIETWLAEKLGA